MPPLEKYLEHADELAQEVMKVWGPIVQTGHAPDLSAEFKALVDKTCLYRDVRGLADNHREHNVLSEPRFANGGAHYAIGTCWSGKWCR